MFYRFHTLQLVIFCFVLIVMDLLRFSGFFRIPESFRKYFQESSSQDLKFQSSLRLFLAHLDFSGSFFYSSIEEPSFPHIRCETFNEIYEIFRFHFEALTRCSLTTVSKLTRRGKKAYLYSKDKKLSLGRGKVSSFFSFVSLSVLLYLIKVHRWNHVGITRKTMALPACNSTTLGGIKGVEDVEGVHRHLFSRE